MEKILVIKLGALGDFIQALGPMAAIKDHHKDAHITILTTGPFEGFARQCGYFDEVWTDKRPKWFDLAGWLALKKRLNSSDFDRIYDLQNNDRSCFYFRLFPSARRPEWVGIAKGASHQNSSPERTAGHAFDGHVQTLGLAGIKNIELDKLAWMKEDISSFDLNKPYVLLIPGSAPSRPEKRWPAEHYAVLAVQLNAAGYQPIILGGNAEKEASKIITQHCPEALNLTGKTSLAQIVTLARDAASAIGNDTGPMHLIGATGCPSLALFSRHSNSARHAPKGRHVQLIDVHELKDLKVEDVMTAFKGLKKEAA